MVALPPYKIIDGYCNYWTKNWYKCDPAPTCPRCGKAGVCVSIERTCTEERCEPVGNMAQAVSTDEAINVGPRFRAPPAEPRTQRAQIARAAEASRN
ncbi:hypothetical protein DPMN_177653 [Dreissena polymorpha]|uniref:Uncharacterized protein n=1 Tax=Dreissena polymorpha TaxID=45954 RepID=A0A9D4EBE4_DREPO|nr:hypothetical protein DPMN_177653 [Dreissena polymorpha]